MKHYMYDPNDNNSLFGIRRGDVDGAVSAVVGADVLLGDGNVTLFVANEVKFDASAPVRDFIHRSAFFLVKFEPGIDTREHAVVGIIARTQQIPLHDLHIDAEQRTAFYHFVGIGILLVLDGQAQRKFSGCSFVERDRQRRGILACGEFYG